MTTAAAAIIGVTFFHNIVFSFVAMYDISDMDAVKKM
jgi:hypothetical protein